MVIDVGSGDNPHPRADVVVESKLDNVDRWGSLTKSDRLVMSEITMLPFRSKLFDVALCYHVLEHVTDPVAAAGELTRIAHRGIIEVPTLYSDVLFQPYTGHKWAFSQDEQGLLYAEHPGIVAKVATTATTLALLKNNRIFRRAFMEDEVAFRVRATWIDSIKIRKATISEVLCAHTNQLKAIGSIAPTIFDAKRQFFYQVDMVSSLIRRALDL